MKQLVSCENILFMMLLELVSDETFSDMLIVTLKYLYHLKTLNIIQVLSVIVRKYYL